MRLRRLRVVMTIKPNGGDEVELLIGRYWDETAAMLTAARFTKPDKMPRIEVR